MNTPLSWIKEYVPDLACSDKEFAERMTLSGSKVESYRRLDKNLREIVIGELLSIAKHPGADKLSICRVSIGEKILQIVTGAQNIAVGDKVPVVLDGGSVAVAHGGGHASAEGMPIKKGLLRGEMSEGMMCSLTELGLDKNLYPDAPETGIYVFPDSAKVGEDALSFLELHDTLFEYEITSNRADCYSVVGLAREAAATFGLSFFPPSIAKTGNEERIEDRLQVEVLDGTLCRRYCARMVKNIRLAPSPLWMQHRLAAVGIRPINNIVDITNYVLWEFGQPMHAFDYDLIEDKKIIVKRACEKDRFITLDGQERILDKDMLMIHDGKKPVAIAGIMGGENSKVGDGIKTMVFESACFDGTNVRLSAKRLGLRTESSAKFEKGLDPDNALAAINRACTLIEELGAGEVVGGVIDVYPVKKEERCLPFEPDMVNRLLGTDISGEEMLSLLAPAGFRLSSVGKTLIIPGFREDIENTADISEEVARFYGYDRIPISLPRGESTMGGISPLRRTERIAARIASFYGFSESMSYSFESPKVFDRLLLPEDSKLRQAVEISNPLGEDYSVMRTISLNGILQSLSTNFNRRNKDVRLFELANIYLPKSLPITELPQERMQFTLGAYGDIDFYVLKGLCEEFLQAAGVRGRLCFDADLDAPYLHPGRKAKISFGDVTLGYLGELHPLVCDQYKIGERVYVAVLDLTTVVSLKKETVKYSGIAKYPAITRDISLVMKKEIPAGLIEGIIEEKGTQLLESFSLFDYYEGSQIEAGERRRP